MQRLSSLYHSSIVIGHSFGGLIAQIILGRGIAAAGIAIDPAPMKGVWRLPFSVLKASFPLLSNPVNFKKAKSLTSDQFRYGFATAVPEDEAKELYARWTIPRPETKVNTNNTTREPLLITGGEKAWPPLRNIIHRW